MSSCSAPLNFHHGGFGLNLRLFRFELNTEIRDAFRNIGQRYPEARSVQPLSTPSLPGAD